MRNHVIPPNFDSSRFSIFGIIKLMALLEAAIGALGFYNLVKKGLWFLSFSYSGDLILLSISFVMFLLILALSSQESISSRLYKVMRFFLRRRKLCFRPIKKRLYIENFQKTETESKPESPLTEDNRLIYYDPKNLCTKALPKNHKEKKKIKHIKITSDQKYTQEFLDFKNLYPKSAIVEMKNGSYSKIMEIKAVNYFSLSENEREALLMEFERFLKIGPFYLQIKIINFPSNLKEYFKILDQKLEDESFSTDFIKSLNEELKVLLNGDQLNREILEHKYYLIFSVRPNGEDEKERKENAFREIRIFEEMIKSRLAKHGIEVLSDTNLNHSNVSKEFFKFLFNYYCQVNFNSNTLGNRIKRVIEDKEIDSNDEETEVPVRDIIAPLDIDLKHSDFIVVNGIYYSYFIVSKFPRQGIPTAFFSKFMNAGSGFHFDYLIERKLKHEITSKLRQRNLINKANLDQMKIGSFSLKESKFIVSSTNYMLEELEKDNEFYFFLPIITFSAPTYEELCEKRDWMKRTLQSYNVGVIIPNYEMESVFRITEPYAQKEKGIFEKYKRNILTSGLTGFYPFTHTSTIHDEGVFLGFDNNNKSPVILDIFNPVSNIFIFGMTGYGKSFLSMLLATRLRMLQTQVFVLSPIKGHEYKKIIQKLGGSFIEIGPGCRDCINILEIRPTYKWEENSLDSFVFSEGTFLHEKIMDIIRFFQLITEDNLTQKQKDYLSPFLYDFYARFGISEDNNSIYREGSPEKGLKTMPVLGDLEKALSNSESLELNELALPLRKFTHGSLSYLNNQTNVDLNNKLCCIDINKALDYKETRSMVLFIVMNYLWMRIRSNRTDRKALIFEEIWKLIENKETADTVKEVFKTIRGYYGTAIGISQNLSDLNYHEVSDGILNNTAIQFFLHNKPNETEKLQEYFKLNSQDYTDITGADKGECLMVTPSKKHFIKILGTGTERKLFETDGNFLQ